MRIELALLLSSLSLTAHAEVFKCIGKYGKATYQSSPCEAAVKAQQLDIKSNPEQEAEAKAKLAAIQNEYETRKAEKTKSENELLKQQAAAAALEISRRNALAQQEQAQAQYRQAEALEKQNQFNNRPLYVLPPTIQAPIPTSPTLPQPRSPRDEATNP